MVEIPSEMSTFEHKFIGEYRHSECVCGGGGFFGKCISIRDGKVTMEITVLIVCSLDAVL